VLRKINPFKITKAVDLTNEEIESLWINMGGNDADTVFQPTSPVPLMLLGGKGSGKTHLMRYYSYPLQRHRHNAQELSALAGLAHDGYIGIYVLLGGLNSERFRGRGQSEDVWRTLFEYYFELWIAQELLLILTQIASEENSLKEIEAELCQQICELFDEPPDYFPSTFADLLNWSGQSQRHLDSEVNNLLFTKTLRTRIRVTRGRLLFGIPQLLAKRVEQLKNVVFSYQLDEFENISEQQQQYINSLLRDRQAPSTFRVGSRLYGVKTYKTYSSDEENREGSEFDKVVLDQRLRQSSREWDRFACSLVKRRLEVYGASTEVPISEEAIERLFDVPDLSWDSPSLYYMVLPRSAQEPTSIALPKNCVVAYLRGTRRDLPGRATSTSFCKD
jgi:hypothetical protein